MELEIPLKLSPTPPKSTTNSATSPRSSAGIRWSEIASSPLACLAALSVSASAAMIVPGANGTDGALNITVNNYSATPGLKSVEVRDTVDIADAPAPFLRVSVSR